MPFDHRRPGGSRPNVVLITLLVLAAAPPSFARLHEAGNLFLDAGVLGETIEAGAAFGATLASGDFNGDGYDDVVVGTPGEDLDDDAPDPLVDAGVVQVVYGGDSGLDLTSSQLWQMSSLGLVALDNDDFGAALATGDFDNDGYDDLAVGAPGAELGSEIGAGFVVVIMGSSLFFEDGFETSTTSRWSLAVP